MVIYFLCQEVSPLQRGVANLETDLDYSIFHHSLTYLISRNLESVCLRGRIVCENHHLPAYMPKQIPVALHCRGNSTVIDTVGSKAANIAQTFEHHGPGLLGRAICIGDLCHEKFLNPLGSNKPYKDNIILQLLDMSNNTFSQYSSDLSTICYILVQTTSCYFHKLKHS